MAKTNRDVVVFFCIANGFDLLLSSKDVYSFKCLFANNLNQYITSWSKSPFRWLNGNESISWRHRKCFSKLCVHRMRTKTPNWCADLVKRSEMFENQHVTSYRIFKNSSGLTILEFINSLCVLNFLLCLYCSMPLKSCFFKITFVT